MLSFKRRTKPAPIPNDAVHDLIQGWVHYIESTGITDDFYTALAPPYVVDNRTDFGTVRMLMANLNAREWYDKPDGLPTKIAQMGGMRSGDTVFDIGAHHCFYALIFEKIVGSTGRVFAFEPFAFHVEVAKRNIALNQSAVALLPIGLGTSSETTVVPEGADSISSKAKGRSELPTAITTEPLLSFARLKPDFLKIDIEGAEITLARQLEEFCPTVRSAYVEYHQPFFKNFVTDENSAAMDLLDVLHRAFGYVYIDEPNKLRRRHLPGQEPLPLGFVEVYCRRTPPDSLSG